MTNTDVIFSLPYLGKKEFDSFYHLRIRDGSTIMRLKESSEQEKKIIDEIWNHIKEPDFNQLRSDK